MYIYDEIFYLDPNDTEEDNDTEKDDDNEETEDVKDDNAGLTEEQESEYDRLDDMGIFTADEIYNKVT